MPELPEVETIVCGLRPRVVGRRLEGVSVRDPKLARVPCALALPTEVEDLRRRGKYILFEFRDRTLVVHLRMSGRLVWAKGRPGGPVRLSLRFPHGGVHLVDPRRLGTAEVVDRFEDALGPEPLEDLAWLRGALAGSRTPVKLWLMDQRKIAGIGNIYAAEILYRARIHPARRADSLTPAEVRRLGRAIPEVLKEAIACQGTTLSDGRYRGPQGEIGAFSCELGVYGREGKPCRRCGAVIERSVLGGRGTYFCPGCQPYGAASTGTGRPKRARTPSRNAAV